MARTTTTPVVYPDPCPDLPIERGPEDKGVGNWVPWEKHRLLSEYLNASRFAWKKWKSRVFLDPFSGPGRIQVAGESFTRDGGAVVAWRSLAKEAPFTNMFVGDLDADRVAACVRRLQALSAPARSFPGLASETMNQMVAAIPPRSLCMAYIDPYNLEYLSFPILETLAKLKKVDLAINFVRWIYNVTLRWNSTPPGRALTMRRRDGGRIVRFCQPADRT
jgi:three-Cys-motif partner protein